MARTKERKPGRRKVKSGSGRKRTREEDAGRGRGKRTQDEDAGRGSSVFPFLLGIVPFRSPSPFLLKNGTEERNGTERFQFWEERNDENRRNDETGRSVPKLALQEKWMENPLKCVKNPNFFACGAYLELGLRKFKEKILKNME